MRRKIFGLLPVPRLSEIPETFLRYLDVNFKRIEDALTELFNVVPAGTVAATYSVIEPTGWLFLRGQTVSAVDYPALAEAMGVTGTFALPDTRGKVIVGLHPSDADWDALGELRGTKTVTLTEAQLASHEHGFATGGYGGGGSAFTVTGGSHNHGGSSVSGTPPNHGHGQIFPGVEDGGGDVGGTNRWRGAVGAGVLYPLPNTPGVDTDQAHAHGISTQAAHNHELSNHAHSINTSGSDAAHDNIQPSIVMNYMIKT